ncbi:MAG: hypothetical protein ACLQMF_03990 [Rectinemataceae bacterium]
MNAHVSSILLGVRDMEKSKRFYMEESDASHGQPASLNTKR